MRPLAIRSLSARSFRNLAAVDMTFGPRFNVLAGENGQGKTNVLEALYVLATSRSFRTSKIPDLVADGEDTASLRGVVVEDRTSREQTIGLRSGVRSVRIDDRRPPTLAAYALRTPTVVFHPGSLALASGAGSERRKLLDRVSLYRSPASLDDAEAYARALRARQRVLEVRGESASDLASWEELAARHGVRLSDTRERAAEELGPEAESAFLRIGQELLRLRVRYVRSAPSTAEAFRDVLASNRVRDRARRAASVGPHRDDVALELSGKPVRSMASQGQQRAIVLALDLAEISVVGSTRDVVPILLLDDVSSELDRATTAALLGALREQRGQVFVTTTRPELLRAVGSFGEDDRVDFVIREGSIRRS